MPNVGYYSEQFGYYEGDLQHGDKVVPAKPEPRDEHVLIDLDIQNEDGTFGTWQHDPDLVTKAMGQIPTDVFLQTVFFPDPALGITDPALIKKHILDREEDIRVISKKVSARMPDRGHVQASRADLLQMAGWLLTYTLVPNTFPPQFTQLTANADGTYTGGLISQYEYDRILPLLGKYGVK